MRRQISKLWTPPNKKPQREHLLKQLAEQHGALVAIKSKIDKLVPTPETATKRRDRASYTSYVAVCVSRACADIAELPIHMHHSYGLNKEIVMDDLYNRVKLKLEHHLLHAQHAREMHVPKDRLESYKALMTKARDEIVKGCPGLVAILDKYQQSPACVDEAKQHQALEQERNLHRHPKLTLG